MTTRQNEDEMKEKLNECRYIGAENLQKRINTHLEKLDVPENINFFDKAFIAGMRFVQEMIDKEPTVDLVKHAKWERYHETKQGLSGTSGTANVVEYEVELVMCSECTEIVEHESNYCPNCGAKMKKSAYWLQLNNIEYFACSKCGHIAKEGEPMEYCPKCNSEMGWEK